MFKFVKQTKTVRDFLLNFGDIDCNPVHQRLDRSPKLIGTTAPSKAQGIIDSMLMGIDIGQITIHETPKGKFKYESIDGGHRKRYIYAFYNNCFPDFESKKYFRDMSREEKNMFLDIELSFCVYQNLTGWQVGRIFRNLNSGAPVNHQEMLNSYGDVPMANVVRETVRTVANVNNRHHELFNYSQKNNDTKKTYSNVAFTNDGLKIDEMVARLFCLYYNGGGLGTSCDKDLEAMYKAEIDKKSADNLKKKVKTCLDFLLLMSEVRKSNYTNGLTQKEFVMFYRLWLHLEQTYGQFKIEDYNRFFTVIYDAYSPYKVNYADQSAELQKISPLDSSKTVGKQFNDSLGEFRPINSVKFPIEQLLANVNILDIITVRDPQRIFPREWRESKLAEQNYRCAVDGTPITMKNSQGAHNIAWSEGGRTVYENLSMVSTKHNRKMGSMSLQAYRELLGEPAAEKD